ncbi:MAG TPA: hypothetical protein VGG86_02160 [Roseiarcus sp.]|jgi:hypothetical protein
MQRISAPSYVCNSATAAYETSKNLADRDAQALHKARSAEVEPIDWVRRLLFGLWLAAAGALAWRHVIWRDEARALSIAIQGDDWIAMLHGLHGEGHPALWYLLLRAAYGITGRPEVLPVLALAIAAAAAWLIVWRSPFPPAVIGLILASHFFIYEFSAMARNYGIGMLILFALAIAYPRCRGRGVALGALLFLLANCNVIATILAGAFLLFWFVEILEETGLRWSPAIANFALNAAIAAAGATLCFATVYPTFNDAAVAAHPAGVGARDILGAIVDPAPAFAQLLGWQVAPAYLVVPWSPIVAALGAPLLIGATFGLIERKGALLACLASLAGLSAFFRLVYPGDYRHEATWLAFVIAMYWLCWKPNRPDPEQPAPQTNGRSFALVRKAGFAFFLVLIGVQATLGLADLAFAAIVSAPESCSRDFAELVSRRPDLKDAILLGDPDYMLEPMHYYLPNRTYFVREQRYGDTVRFTRKARLDLTLGDVLDEARAIHASSGRPVAILLAWPLSEMDPGRIYRESYVWTFSAPGDQIERFRGATTLLAQFPKATSGESYDVYLLK